MSMSVRTCRSQVPKTTIRASCPALSWMKAICFAIQQWPRLLAREMAKALKILDAAAADAAADAGVAGRAVQSTLRILGTMPLNRAANAGRPRQAAAGC